jgi:hypothetical protein
VKKKVRIVGFDCAEDEHAAVLLDASGEFERRVVAVAQQQPREIVLVAFNRRYQGSSGGVPPVCLAVRGLERSPVSNPSFDYVDPTRLAEFDKISDLVWFFGNPWWNAKSATCM